MCVSSAASGSSTVPQSDDTDGDIIIAETLDQCLIVFGAFAVARVGKQDDVPSGLFRLREFFTRRLQRFIDEDTAAGALDGLCLRQHVRLVFANFRQWLHDVCLGVDGDDRNAIAGAEHFDALGTAEIREIHFCLIAAHRL